MSRKEKQLMAALDLVEKKIVQAERGLKLSEASRFELRERLAELELSLEDQGWERLTGSTQREFSRDALTKICSLARLYWLKNPLVKRAVATQTLYVFGQGVEISAQHPLVNEFVQTFLDDRKNRVELTSHQAMMTKEDELQLMANLFFVFFPDANSGIPRLRSIPFDEVTERICNPEDAKEPWYYKRVWQQRNTDGSTTSRTALYPDMHYRPKGGYPNAVDGVNVEKYPTFHVAVNKLSDMEFGVSEVYASIDWAKSYKGFLENWLTIIRSLARFAWKAVAKDTAGMIEMLEYEDDNPAPTVGSAFVSTEGVDFQPIRTSGATTSARDGHEVIHMISAATGIFYHYLTGDPSTGNLATAKSMERPMEFMFTARQQLWHDAFQEIIGFAIEQGIMAGKLPGNVGNDGVIELGKDTASEDPALRDQEVELTVDVDFPPILEHDVNQQVKAIVDATTLSGFAPAGTLDLELATRKLLQAMGEKNVDEIIDTLFPKDEEGNPIAPPPLPEERKGELIEAVRALEGVANELVRLSAAAEGRGE